MRKREEVEYSPRDDAFNQKFILCRNRVKYRVYALTSHSLDSFMRRVLHRSKPVKMRKWHMQRVESAAKTK